MELKKNSITQQMLIVVLSFATWILFSQAFILACHPSKNPEILFLFSYNKFGLICIFSLVAFCSFCYAKKLSNKESF